MIHTLEINRGKWEGTARREGKGPTWSTVREAGPAYEKGPR